MNATTNEPFVTLRPAFDGPTAGYQAVMVRRTECEWTGEDVDDVLRSGPFCDAPLIARSRAIGWAAELGVPFHD